MNTRLFDCRGIQNLYIPMCLGNSWKPFKIKQLQQKQTHKIQLLSLIKSEFVQRTTFSNALIVLPGDS